MGVPGQWPVDEDLAVERVVAEAGKVFSGASKTFGRNSDGRFKLEPQF
jgi:hypothetical protein